ncbi:MAG: 50S ribosomal protein L1 [Spirochaetales bacterium]|jgi:large subunit ribosomal protein L1|nr:50S ribosomal protein L1 [Exilispira sp.]NMC67540.1 50S ribosomal protein L1 [Spirochaetales bacterium]
MTVHGKLYRKAKENIEPKAYNIKDAISLIKKVSYAKFDETFEASFNLKLEKKHSVRSTILLPNSFGKTRKVLVFAKGQKAEEAISAGADYAGDEEYIEKIKNGWLDFDACIATPDMMKEIGKIAKILGPKGLMPNPKTGTVTDNIANAVKEIKQGKLEYKADKAGVVHVMFAKKSMTEEQILENFNQLYQDLLKKRPSDLKGNYILSIYLSTTMSPSVKVDISSLA